MDVRGDLGLEALDEGDAPREPPARMSHCDPRAERGRSVLLEQAHARPGRGGGGVLPIDETAEGPEGEVLVAVTVRVDGDHGAPVVVVVEAHEPARVDPGPVGRGAIRGTKSRSRS